MAVQSTQISANKLVFQRLGKFIARIAAGIEWLDFDANLPDRMMDVYVRFLAGIHFIFAGDAEASTRCVVKSGGEP